tara:strand:+ start:80 stop:1270 length:1191 start_codon:yes stop_codon:yes gene_type:complete
MKTTPVPFMFAALMVLSSLSGCIFDDGETSGSDEVLAVFNYAPTTNLKAGDVVSFDASASTPSGGITYRWDFTGDGSIDATGRSTEWTFEESGTYTVELSVSDGTKSSSQTKDVTVVEATAQPPMAEITQYASDEDCDNDDLDESTHIVLWICEMDKSMTDRDISATTTVNLDASDSESGDTSQYITSWNWDLNADVDSDNDGDTENDADLTGESVDWNNVEPGEYQLHLTIENSAGMTDSDSIKVYVSYAGQWSDFEMGGNTSGNAVTLDFDVKVVYDKDNGNTIRKLVGELTYPQIDDGCFETGTGNCRAKLDIHALNEDDEEASNTSETGLDQRDDGDDCNDDDNDCVFLTLSSYMFTDTESTYDDGDWVLQVRNEKVNDLQVESFIIRLHYK